MKFQHLSKHHRKCLSRKGSNTPTNISIVDEKRHQSWHNIFGNDEPKDIAQHINEVWLDPDWEFICIPRKKNTKQKNEQSELGGA